MARVKVTNKNIKALLTQWAQGTNRVDELVYFNGEIDEKEWANQAWQLGSMIIDFQADKTSYTRKITFVEKL